MANEYYRKHKELLKKTRIKFNLQINVDKTQLGELEIIKKQLSKMREYFGLQRGTCKTANLKLMQELLDAWMFLHKDKLDRQAAQDHEMSDAPHTMFPVDGDQELSRVLHSVTFTPVSASSLFDNLNDELGLVSGAYSLPVQDKQQLHVTCQKEDEIYTVCKASLTDLVSRLIGEYKKCGCGAPWEASSINVKRCTPNNHVCVLEVKCQAPTPVGRHKLQWHSSTVVGNNYYNNLR